MSPSKIFLYFCLSFIFGIFLNSFFKIPQLFWLGFLIMGLILISVFWQKLSKKLVVIGFCILFLVAGILRYQTVFSRVENSPIKDFIGKEIVLIGMVEEEPDVGEKITRLRVRIQDLDGQKINEKVLITTWHYPEYQYGDKLEIKGELEFPPGLEDFDYPAYLQKEGVYAVMSWPEIKLVEKNLGNPFMKSLFSFKNKFKQTTRTFFSSPQQGFLEALIFGDEENILQEWKEKLNITGTRHIAAVSGMNVTIISFLVLSFMLNLGLWRHHAFYLSIFLVFLYILMIGAPATAVRAAIMTGFLMTAQYFGRTSKAERAAVFAASLMLFQNPLLLRYDIGFQLSFLAILGIIYFQPFFFDLFKKVPNPKIFPLQTTLSATLAPQIFTLPILVYNFGRISLVSPIANILIVPAIAPLTIFIFIFGILAILIYPLAILLSWPIWLFLTYIILVVDGFSKLPFTFLTIENVHWAFIFVFYLILTLIARRLQEKQRLKFLNY